MLHYVPQHVSSSTLLILRRTNFITTACGIVTLCKQPYSTQVESGLDAQFLYSSTICMLHYDPQHVSSSTLLIHRRTNCITTASGIVTLCKQPYSMQVVSGPQSTCILYGSRSLLLIMKFPYNYTNSRLEL